MSESEESLLDYSNGSSDLYEPTTDSESDENVVVMKRKVRNVRKWKRNITTTKRRAEGKAHVNSVGNVVPPRATGKRCECKYRCFHYVSEELRKTALKKINAIGGKHKQDIYLAGQIVSKNVVRRRPKMGRPNINSMKIGSFDRKVCKTAFGSIHGVSLKRVENIAAELKKVLYNCE